MIANFIHENAEDVRVDLVRFGHPVMINEIRIIPQNCPPHVSMTTADKLGKTAPDSFKLDVYCNDSTNPLTPTFETLGILNFSNDSLSLSITQTNPCDMIVIRGLYTAISVCFYGLKTPPHSSRDSFPLPGFPQTSSRSPSPFSDHHCDKGYRKEPHSPTDTSRGLDVERGTKRTREGKDVESNKEWSSLLDSYNTLFEPFSPDHSPEHSFDMYDDDIPSSKRSATTDAGFEEFSDEEIPFAEEDFEMQDTGLDYEFEDAWMTTTVEFNPYQTEITKLEAFPILFETPHETLLNKKPKSDYSSKRSHSDEGTRLRDLINKQKTASISFKWVESVEELSQQLYPGLAQLSNRSEKEGKESLQCVCKFVSTCLDESVILKQSPPLNIRVLKTGLRLAESVTSLGQQTVRILLQQRVLERLCEIVSQSSSLMPSSIKLLAIKVLVAMLDYPVTMERFLGWNEEDSKSKSPYRMMLEVVLSNQTSRVQSAVSCMLQKAHIYELLANLQNCVDQVIACTPIKKSSTLLHEFWNNGGEGDVPSSTRRIQENEMEVSVERKNIENVKVEKRGNGDVPEEGDLMDVDSLSKLDTELITKIAELLEQLYKSFERVESAVLLSPLKSLPGVNPQVEALSQEPFVGVARMCQARRLLEGLLVLLNAPSLMDTINVFSGIRDMILQLLSSQNGLMLLSSNPPVINAIIRTLIQSVDNEVPLDALHPLTSFQQQDSGDTCSPLNLGMLMIHHLQVLQLLDTLRHAPKQTMTDLESECLPALHALFSMTLVPIGNFAVSHVLSLDNNLTILLPFMEPRGYKEHDNKLSRSSISSRYAAVLILQLLRSPSNLSHDCLTPHSRRLLSIAEFFQDNQSTTMSGLYSWLHPLKLISDTPTTISSLMGVIREGVSQLSWSKPNKGSAAIITSLHLILVRCCSSPDKNIYKKSDTNLQQTEAIVALFSSSAINVITSLLKKLADILLPLWSQKQTVGPTNAGVLSILASLSLRLLRLLLCELLDDGTFQLRDTRVLSALFSLHTIMCSAPYSGVFQTAAPEIQSLIVDCLVTYTKPENIESEEPISPINSCWCLLLDELLSYSQATPQAFLSGIMLLSELLPMPLPLQSPRTHSANEISAIVQFRNLWAAHLLPLSSSLSSLLEMLIPSMCLSLQQILRRVCAQLSDLAPSLAMVITRMVASKILAHVDSEDEGGKEADPVVNKKETYSPLVNVLTLCAVLSSQPMFKTSLLSLLHSKMDKDEEGEEGYQRFIPLLLFLVQKKETILPAKLCVMTILQSLLNHCLTLAEPVKDDQPSIQQLADSLPTVSQLEHILSAVLSHIGSYDEPFSTVAVGLKVISAASQHLPGRTLLLLLIPSSVKRFSSLLKRLISAIRESTPPPPDALQCASLFLDTLSDLATPENPTLSPNFPLSLLKCCIYEEGDLLRQLLSAIQEGYKEEQDQRLAEDFTATINDHLDLFVDISLDPTGLTPPNIELPAMQNLEQQFISRVSLIQTAVDASSSPEYWLSSPPHEEGELEPDTTSIDLSELASETCPKLNLQEELKKQLLPSPPSTPVKSERKRIIVSGPEAQKRLREAIQQRRVMGRGRDVFRTRARNTSRPPSMHVDDFMNMGSRLPGGMQRGNMMRGRMHRGSPRGAMLRGRGTLGLGSAYMMPPPLYPLHMGGRWMGGLSTGHYPRRDLPGLPLTAAQSWESRAQHFLASVHKPDPLSNRAMWSHIIQDPYNRARSARTVEMSYGSRPMSTSRISSRLSSSRRT